MPVQPGVLAPVPRLARYLAFELVPGTDVHAALARLGRMAGHEDGITDALFRFTRPLTGAYFRCPPVATDGRLDLRALGL